MKTKIQVLFGIVVIIAAAYWSISSLWPNTYAGSSIMFPIGGGHVQITNLGSEAIPIEMRTESRSGTFRIASSELGLAESAKREGTGRSSFYTVSFDLPPGQARIDVTRGSEVQLISRSDTRIEAVVVPLAANTLRLILIASGIAIAWALYYISSATNHRWLALLRKRLSGKDMELGKSPA